MNKSLSRKRIFAGLLVVVLVLILNYIFSHSIVTIQGAGDDEKIIEISKLESGEKIRKFSLKADSKKFILKKGQYKILVSSKDRVSYYQKGVGGFKKTIGVETRAQKSAEQIGQSEYDCSGSLLAGSILYFPCTSYSGVLSLSSNGTTSPIVSPSADALFVHSHGEGEAEKSDPVSSQFLPFSDRFLEVFSKDRKVEVNEIDQKGARTGKGFSLEGFDGYIDRTKYSSYSERFSLFDDKKKELLIFGGLSNEGVSRINLQDELDYDPDLRFTSIYMTEKLVYVVSAQNPTDFDDHSNTSSKEPEHEEAKVDGKVLVVDLDNNSLVKKYSLPSDFIPKKSVYLKDEGLFIIPTNIESNGYIMANEEKLEPIWMAHSDIKDMCVTSSGAVYYSTTEGAQIFNFSSDSGGSFLAYTKPEGNISRINCVSDQLYFILDSAKDGVVDQNIHYRLTDLAHTNTRIENVLPIYADVGPDVIKLYSTRGGYSVKLLSDGDGNGGPDKDQAKRVLFDNLTALNVNTENLDLIFTY